MSRYSNRIALSVTAAATAVIAAVTTPAGAVVGADTEMFEFPCSPSFNSLPTAPRNLVGVIYGHSATLDATGSPTFATLSCQVEVNGVPVAGTTGSYSGFAAQAGVTPIAFTAGMWDFIDICDRVQYADGYDTGWDCEYPIPLTEGGLSNLLDYTYANDVEPLLCPTLAAHPGDYGPITIGPDGDPYVPDPLGLGLDPVYDCPPYGNF